MNMLIVKRVLLIILLCITAYVYAPLATSIRVGSADIIFCGPNTVVKTPCNDIRRGEWYTERGYIYSKTNKNFKYKLIFSQLHSNGFSEISMDNLNPALEIMELEKNIAICRQKIKEDSPKEDSAEVQNIRNTFDDAIMEIRDISIIAGRGSK